METEELSSLRPEPSLAWGPFFILQLMHPRHPAPALGHWLMALYGGGGGGRFYPQVLESATCDTEPLARKPSLPPSPALPFSTRTSVIAHSLTNPPRDVWVIRRFFIY